MGYFNELPALGREISPSLLLIGAASLIPMIIGCIYQEWTVIPWMALATISLCGVGLILKFLPGKKGVKPRVGLSIAGTALIWVVVGIFGSFPFLYTGMPFIDCAFESMSAWTGTGFSIAPNIEEWPNTLLFWRSFMQWIGGLGIIAFALTVASRSGLIKRGLYRSEGRSEAFMPSVIATAFQMWKIYFVLTAIAIIAILLTGVGLWDAINLALCAIATGGMTIYSDGIAHFGNFALEMVLIPIMIAGAIPFRLYYLTYVNRSPREILRDKVLHLMLGVFIFVSAVLILQLVFSSGLPLIDAVREALFMTGSAVSSTGFQNTAMLGWGASSIIFLSVFILIGGAQGSTSGGIKLERIQVMFEALVWWFKKTLLSPKACLTMKHNGKPIKGEDAEELISRSLLLILFFILMIVLIIVILLCDPYFSSNVVGTIFDVCSCVGNNGATAGLISAAMPDYSKILLFIVMWIARLEVIPVMILLWGIFRGFGWEPVTKTRR
ncbi:MAG: TrkH family potassium uptake protein [Methanocorpusculum sp.]|nr:TrkH family potassium uptake protein [Methanocorpusculum sp.]